VIGQQPVSTLTLPTRTRHTRTRDTRTRHTRSTRDPPACDDRAVSGWSLRDVLDGPNKMQGRGWASTVTDIELATLRFARHTWDLDPPLDPPHLLNSTPQTVHLKAYILNPEP